jgi:hypothetical protein
MAHEKAPYQDRITKDPNVMVGKPVVRVARAAKTPPTTTAATRLGHPGKWAG